MIEYCEHDENDKFFVKFHNSAKFPIDVKLLDDNLDLKVVKSGIDPEGDLMDQAFFKNKFAFTKFSTIERLNASANGRMAKEYDGCLFKPEKGQMITVYISEGTKLS